MTITRKIKDGSVTLTAESDSDRALCAYLVYRQVTILEILKSQYLEYLMFEEEKPAISNKIKKAVLDYIAKIKVPEDWAVRGNSCILKEFHV